MDLNDHLISAKYYSQLSNCTAPRSTDDHGLNVITSSVVSVLVNGLRGTELTELMLLLDWTRNKIAKIGWSVAYSSMIAKL